MKMRGISGLTVSGHALFRNGHEKKAAELYALAIACWRDVPLSWGYSRKRPSVSSLRLTVGPTVDPRYPQLLHAYGGPEGACRP